MISADRTINAYMQRFELFREENGVYASMIYHTSRSRNDWTSWEWPIRSSAAGNTRRQMAILQSRLNQDPAYILDLVTKGMEDPNFALGCSSRRFSNTTWLALEADSEGIVTEDNACDLLREDVVKTFLDNGVPIHIMLSGNRSAHLHIFFSKPLETSFLNGLLNTLSLCFRVPFCSSSLNTGMRLPGFRHQQTGALSRYLGTLTRDEVVEYLENARVCELNPKEFAHVCSLIWDRYGTCSQSNQSHSSILNTVCTVSDKERKDASNNASHILNIVCTVSDENKEEDDSISSSILNTVCTVSESRNSFVTEHPDRQEFERYLQSGIPRGMFQNIVCREKQFALWLTHLCRSKDKALRELRRVARIGVSDLPIVASRSAFANMVMRDLQYDLRPVGTLEGELSEEDISRIEAALEVVKASRKRIDIEKGRATAAYMMKAARYGATGSVSVGQIADLLGVVKTAAKGYMDLFCVYGRVHNGKIIKHRPVAPLFRMKREATRKTARLWEVIE